VSTQKKNVATFEKINGWLHSIDPSTGRYVRDDIFRQLGIPPGPDGDYGQRFGLNDSQRKQFQAAVEARLGIKFDKSLNFDPAANLNEQEGVGKQLKKYGIPAAIGAAALFGVPGVFGGILGGGSGAAGAGAAGAASGASGAGAGAAGTAAGAVGAASKAAGAVTAAKKAMSTYAPSIMMLLKRRTSPRVSGDGNFPRYLTPSSLAICLTLVSALKSRSMSFAVLMSLRLLPTIAIGPNSANRSKTFRSVGCIRERDCNRSTSAARSRSLS
jgi:hypothetical protein